MSSARKWAVSALAIALALPVSPDTVVLNAPAAVLNALLAAGLLVLVWDKR